MGYQTPYTFVRRMAVLFVILGSLVCSLYVAFVHAEVQNIADRFGWPVKDRSVFRPNGGYEFNISGTGHFHPGLDWNYESGDRDLGLPVLSVANGVVDYAGSVTGNPYGNVVLIRHTLSDQTLVWSFYAHLNSYTVSNGQAVQIGDEIGAIGKSGCTPCNAHLHWEIRLTQSSPKDWPQSLPSSQLEQMYVQPEEFINNFNYYTSASTAGYVSLFTDSFFRGGALGYLHPGHYTLENTAFNNIVSSIGMGGLTATAYDQNTLTGDWLSLYTSDTNLANNGFTDGVSSKGSADNAISSLTIYGGECSSQLIAASTAAATLVK